MRKSNLTRKTAETDITLTLNIDGSGKSEISSGVGFLDHMLTLFTRHGGFDLAVKCRGDTEIDNHHTVEDIGICLGSAFAEALGDMRGIRRYADVTIPMDEALILCAVDVSGRALLGLDVPIDQPSVGEFETELLEEFLAAFTRKAGITIHLRKLSGKNAHHIIEAVFKSLAHALREACAMDEANAGKIPSTKGTLL
ncbi:MAG: imidazoleglycerol-phosphate dehydratase HisB [Oscillospiraceae bacterium]|nr:imidazoleglycerol-phosphate dehydratase HisB [Oscillospiraceae bacterium]